MMRLSRDELIPQYKKLVDLIHGENCPAIAQLAQGGYYRSGRLTEPDDTTAEEIQSIVQMFIDAARRAKEAGFDGVQLHAAHFFLRVASQFTANASPGASAWTRSGFTTRGSRFSGFPLKVFRSGASTLPQWIQISSALG